MIKGKKRLKIAILLPGFGKVERGAEHAVEELAKRLAKDFKIVIFSRGRKFFKKNLKIEIKKIWAVDRDNKLTNFIYNFIEKISPKLASWLDVFNLSPQGIEMLSFSLLSFPYILLEDFDLFYPVSGFWGAFFCWLVRAVKKTPFIYVSHGGEEPMIARLNPNVYVALTPFTRDWLEKFRPGLKVVYIPNGVDIRRFSPLVKPAKLSLEKPIFLTAAALIKSKRIDLVVKAVAKIKKGSLLVLGDGSLKQELESLGYRLLGSSRFTIKKVPYRLMSSYYRAASVFTLASQKDPAPLVYLEAASCGLPIVAPDEERRKSVLGKAAFYCDVKNAQEYSKTLTQAEKSNLGKEARKLALKFSWEKIASKYKKLISDLI